MNKNALKKILEHPDKDEIISKLVIGIPSKDIYDWLKEKYSNVSEAKFVIAEKSIKSFQDNYLDIYSLIQEDFAKTKTALATGTPEDQLKLAVQNNTEYKNIMLANANTELDVRKIITNLAMAIETRLAQVFDEIQENPRNINTRVDRLLIEYMEVMGNTLEKYYKFTEEPQGIVVQHNVNVQISEHMTVLYDAIKETLAQMDNEASLYFISVLQEKLSKVKLPTTDKETLNPEIRLAEAKLLSETINKKMDN